MAGMPELPGVPKTGKQLIGLIVAVAIVMAIFHFFPVLRVWERFKPLAIGMKRAA